MTGGPLYGPGRARRMAPFGGALLLGLALSPFTPHRGDVALVGVVIALLALFWLTPWARLPVWTQAVPFLLVLPLIGMLRHVNGGSTSGYAPLALLPVLWLALHFGRRELLAGLTVLGATFVVPLALGDAVRYPAGSARLAVLLVATAAVIGFCTSDLTRQLRYRAADLQAIARVARQLPSDDRAREAVCAAAREMSGADFVMLFEPAAGERSLVSSATDGVDLDATIAMAQASAAVDAFRNRRQLFLRDCAGHPLVNQRLVKVTGVASLFVQPVLRGDEALGVLVLGYRSRQGKLRPRLTESLDIVAAEASLAIDRADLLARLAAAAHTDGLTGAANRRGWEVAVARDLAPSDGPGVTLALLDLDHFKAYNDRHGHLAGDVLLRECVQRWKAVLRAGDTLARWGGEEFALLLPGCDAQGAALVLERLCAVVPSGCSVSVGATSCSGGDDPAIVMGRADAALYAAKRAGRARVAWAPVDGAAVSAST